MAGRQTSSRIRWVRVLFAVYLVCVVLLVGFSHPTPSAVVVLAVTAGALAWIVHRHARATLYRCPACGNRFALSAWKDFSQPHGGEKKYARCPRCGATGWCEEVAD
jgi:DNA-directed RNA polymerase subunit RPC12/RpoP